jgi:hypothetical protein
MMAGTASSEIEPLSGTLFDRCFGRLFSRGYQNTETGYGVAEVSLLPYLHRGIAEPPLPDRFAILCHQDGEEANSVIEVPVTDVSVVYDDGAEPSMVLRRRSDVPTWLGKWCSPVVNQIVGAVLTVPNGYRVLQVKDGEEGPRN